MKTRFLSLIVAMAATQAFATTVVDPSLASSQPAAGSDPLMESAVSAIQAPASEATGITFDVNVGTQGLGLSVGYEFNKYLKMRVRGAYLEADYEDTWSDVDGKIEYDGNNAGIIFDYHPFGGVFHLSAGVNFSKMTLSANASMEHGVTQGDYELGGYTFTVDSDKASIDGEYDWNDVQPYLGIGWSTDGDGDRSLYFTFDIGVNFIGKGKFNINSIKGIANVTGPNGEDLGAVTDQIAEDAIREEGKDFFKIADDIFVYPVIQLGMGYRF